MATNEKNDAVGGCPRNGQLCKEVTELIAKWPELIRRQENAENDIKAHAESLKNVMEFQGGTKVYVAEIKEQIKSLEDRLFTFMNDLVKNLTTKDASDEERAHKERTDATKNWIEFAKWIIGGTIVVIVAYIFGNGGK